jgi:para-aminobenzoate synthetase component 1
MDRINSLASNRTPFLFVISYDKSKIYVQSLKELDKNIFFKIDKYRNYPKIPIDKSYYLKKYPIDFETYRYKLDKVLEEIKLGNTYLLNLTFKTPIETNLSLKEIFLHSKAKYKLYFKDKFICFSPEKFIEIKDNTISTYPMKGTIDANIPDAKELILSDNKEMAEHIMIVDLMRNDLGMVGKDIKVTKFRYIDKIKAGEIELLQVSSKIEATLAENWRDNLGDILYKILPAGSITGTPKRKTIEIIDNIEDYNRNFYTGIFGIFDGESLYSAVMIRFIDKENGKLYYKSGGGITIDSKANNEYNELINKIYLPL